MMRRFTVYLVWLFSGLALLSPDSGWSQQASVCPAVDGGRTDVDGGGAAVVHVRGEVERALDLTVQELARLPRRQIRIEEDDGSVARYEGVALVDILARAGVPTESLRGPQAASVVVAEARDGYRAAFALAELDEAFSDRLIVLADRKDGDALSADEGPYRVVMRGERRHSRWIRQVTCLRVVRP